MSTKNSSVSTQGTVATPSTVNTTGSSASAAPQSKGSTINFTSTGDVVGAFFHIMQSYSDLMNMYQDVNKMQNNNFVQFVGKTVQDMRDSAKSQQWATYSEAIGCFTSIVAMAAPMLVGHYLGGGKGISENLKGEETALSNLKRTQNALNGIGIEANPRAVLEQNGFDDAVELDNLNGNDAFANDPNLPEVQDQLKNNPELLTDTTPKGLIKHAYDNAGTLETRAQVQAEIRQKLQTEIDRQTRAVNSAQIKKSDHDRSMSEYTQILKGLNDGGAKFASGAYAAAAKNSDADSTAESALQKLTEQLMQTLSSSIQGWGQNSLATGDAMSRALGR